MTEKYAISKLYPKRRAFVTGASLQLKRALCMELAKDGWVIGFADTSIELLHHLKNEINESGGEAIACLGSTTSVVSFEQIASSFLSKTAGIDLLINCTGISQESTFGDFSIEQWQSILNENQMAVLYGSHFLMPNMIHNKSGHIINVFCTTDSIHHHEMVPYNMAGGALHSLSKSIRSKFKNENILVTSVTARLYTTKANHSSQHIKLNTIITEKTMAALILKAAGERRETVEFPSKETDSYECPILNNLKRFFQ